jgi:hypothetical protein
MPRCGGVRVIRGDSYNVTRVSTLTRVAVTPSKRIACKLLRTRSPINVVLFPVAVYCGMSGHFSLTILPIGCACISMRKASLVARLKRSPGARK